MTTPIPEANGDGVREDCQWSDWRHVKVGMQVALQSAGWTVTVKNGTRMVVVRSTPTGNPDRDTLSGPPPEPGKQVMILYPGHPMYATPPSEAPAQALVDSTAARPEIAADLAVAAITLRISGTVLASAQLDPDGSIDRAVPFECPPVAGMPDVHLRTHLTYLHEVGGHPQLGSAPRAALLAAHASTTSVLPHRHEPLP